MLRSKKAETTLYAELIRRGLPADYARRTAEELDDHRADLLAGLRVDQAGDSEAVANTRLGETRVLAKRIACEYQQRSLFGRWPLVSFLLLPPVLLCVAWTGLFYGYAMLLWAAGFDLSQPGETGRAVASAWTSYYVAVALLSVLIPVIVTWVYAPFALARVQSRAYLVLACLSFGLMNGLVHHDVWIDPNDPERAMNVIGAPIPYIAAPKELLNHYAKPMQGLQLLVPVAVGVCLLVVDSRRRRVAISLLPEAGRVARFAA